MREVTAVEAKVKFGSLLEAVEGGEEVVVTRNGKRIARMLPVEEEPALRARAIEQLKHFGDARRLGMDWKALRDAGRK